MTEADIGCAVGGGSDIAIEAADIVLMKNDPLDVPRAIRLSRLTITNIKENLFWAFCYNRNLHTHSSGAALCFRRHAFKPDVGGACNVLKLGIRCGQRFKIKE